MDIQCPGCGSLNAFNTDEITQSGKRIECNNCKLPFLIRPQQSPSGQVEAKDRVMVANANPPFRDAIRDFLAGNGFEVFLVKDGVEALQFLEMATPPGALVYVSHSRMLRLYSLPLSTTRPGIRGYRPQFMGRMII